MCKHEKCGTWSMVQSVAAMLVWFGMVAIVPVRAGDLDSPGAPTDEASKMYTLEAIYNRLSTGAAGAKSGFAEPTAGPTAGTGRTLDAVMGKAPAVHANAAATTEVLSGKTFWGLSAWAWGQRIGAMANIGAQNITPGTAAQTISQGYHNGAGAVAGDTGLVTGNIRSGVTIFGVAGKTEVVDTTSGDAAAGNLLSGKKAWVDGSEVTGGMANIGAQSITPGTAAQTISQGYHNGSGAVAGDTDLLTGNIRSGVTIFGVAGKTEVVDTTSGDAAAGDLLSGKKAWVGGSEVSGGMANIGAQNITPSTSTQTISQGYHNGSGSVAGDASLVTGNIRSGVNIFGVAGKTEVVDTTSGDAVTSDLLFGKKAWVGGSEITGNVAAGSNVNGGNGLKVLTIPDGLYTGSKTATANDTNLATGNVRSGVTIFGVAGKTEVVDTTSGDAAAGDLLSGKKAWADGAEVTGSMANVGVQNITPGTISQSITQGYHSGSGSVAGDADLVTGNIRSGMNIFGVAGDSNVVNTSSGDAVVGDLLSGKKAWVDGAEVTGTMTNIGAQSITPGTSVQTITQGYHNGTGSVAGDADLVTGNIRSGVNIFGVAGDSNVVNTSSGDAAAGDLLSGKKAWVGGSEITGNVTAGSNVNGGNGSKAFTIPDGLYSGSKTATANDTNLVTGNIRSGVTIFGVAGKTEVVDTTSGDAVTSDVLAGKKAWVDGSEVTGTRPTSPVPKTGQTPTVPLNPAPTGSDGDLQKGVAWPSPRFTDNGNGTVTDNLTGLVWLKNANAFGARTWATALTDCATLNSGEAGLTDGSVEGAWRLPNVRELQSLIDYSRYNPALCNAAGTGQWTSGDPFTGVQSSNYWSSTTLADYTDDAWYVILSYGYVITNAKTLTIYVWPVRSGQ